MTNEIKISFEKPPVYDDICKTFSIIPRNVYYTYGDTIYNPDKLDIPPEIIAHEEVHMRQQNYNNEDASLWWGKYLREPEFRLNQEARGYGRQYEVICDIIKDRNQRNKYLFQLATSLSGPLYNNIIRHSEAMKLIKSFSKI